MAAIIAHPGMAEALEAFVAGYDEVCDVCARDLFAGIDEWHRCETDDGSGGSEVIIVCEYCHEDEYEAWLDFAAELRGP